MESIGVAYRAPPLDAGARVRLDRALAAPPRRDGDLIASRGRGADAWKCARAPAVASGLLVLAATRARLQRDAPRRGGRGRARAASPPPFATQFVLSRRGPPRRGGRRLERMGSVATPMERRGGET
jgi:hypothetical protein